jgi:hypothetical protein
MTSFDISKGSFTRKCDFAISLQVKKEEEIIVITERHSGRVNEP